MTEQRINTTATKEEQMEENTTTKEDQMEDNTIDVIDTMEELEEEYCKERIKDIETVLTTLDLMRKNHLRDCEFIDAARSEKQQITDMIHKIRGIFKTCASYDTSRGTRYEEIEKLAPWIDCLKFKLKDGSIETYRLIVLLAIDWAEEFYKNLWHEFNQDLLETDKEV